MIRKKGIISLVIIVMLFVAALFIFTDAWLEGMIEDYGSQAWGAKIEIDNLDVSLISLKIEMNRLQMTDPDHTMRNMIETGKIAFQLNMPALFEKKIIIENVQVDSIQTFTKREKDGKIHKKKTKIVPGVVDRQIIKAREKVKTELPIAKVTADAKEMNLDKIIKDVDVQTPGKIDSLQKHYQARLDFWENELGQIEAKEDIQKLKDELKQIEPGKIKKLKELQSYLKKVDRFRKNVDSLKKVYEQTHKGLSSDLKDMQQGPELIKKWAREDYTRVGNKMDLPDLDKTKVAELLLGQQIMDMYAKFSYYHGKYSNYVAKQKSDQPEKQKPPRLKGQTIHFVKPQALPSFWIKNVRLSGKTSQGFIVEGDIKDVCFQQQVIMKPTVVDLKGTRKDKASLEVTAVLDHINEKYKDHLQFSLNAFPVRNYKLVDNDYLPNFLKKGTGDVGVEFTAKKDTFNTSVSLTVRNAQYQFSESAGANDRIRQLKNIIQDAFSEITTVKVNSQLNVQRDKSNLKINSNLDNAFTKAMKKVIGKEFEKMKGELQRKVDAQIEPYQEKLEKQLAGIAEKLNKKIKQQEAVVKSYEAEISEKKKELEKEINKKLKDKGGKILDKLF